VTQREVKNVAASVRARLLNSAKEQGESFDQMLVYFAIERFLYRLAQTQWADRLVVKGAIMLRAWGAPLGRPTRDIDFTGSLDNSPEGVAAAVRECLAIAYPADGLEFDREVATTAINVEDGYPGVRAIVTGNLDGARFRLQLDIGIDDAVVPDPEWVEYPTLLDLSAPRVLAYMPATAIAEKFEAMVNLGAANSRMKDFYDIWLLSQVHDFEGRQLADAFRATFSHRGTDLPATLPVALTPDFYADPLVRVQWEAFVTRNRLSTSTLDSVCTAIAAFAMPVAAAAADDDDEHGLRSGRWVPGEGWLPAPVV
jgi:predicted nucleotidyltransferase component of viral defense system